MTDFRNILFVPHGSPTFALAPGAAGAAMSRMAGQLAAPRAIVVLSPHWDTAVPTVSSATRLETLHDFYGFPPALYEIDYPATGCPEVAREVAQALQAAGFDVADSQRGLDHGAWQPLRQMLPDTDVPIVPLSMQTHAGPQHAWRIGLALAGLPAQGIWVVTSGNLTHNLGDLRSGAGHAAPPAYVQRFTDWVAEQLAAGQLDALLDYRQRHPDARRAHPGEDHLLPLFTALGAAGAQARAHPYFRGIDHQVIAMDGYAFLNPSTP